MPEIPTMLPTGLVLSGGGAKGAYQVGVLKALLEVGANIDMVAGASIGTLNGAVLACAPSLSEGVQRLETLWGQLAAESPVKANIPAYLKLLAGIGLVMGQPLSGLLAQIPGMAQSLFGARLGAMLDDSLISDEPLRALLNDYLDADGLTRGLPLYVSIFETKGGLVDILRCIVAESGLIDTPPSCFVHVQSLPEHERRNALLASAAIPLLYQARQVGSGRYSDGGQGGWKTMQGNTPITPLIEAGCRQVIVTHLSDGSLWSRHAFPDTTILEIRPQTSITPDDSLTGSVKAVLGFDPESISRLMGQGYQDTLHCVGRVMKATQSHQALLQSEHMLDSSLERGHASDAALTDAMSRLR